MWCRVGDKVVNIEDASSFKLTHNGTDYVLQIAMKNGTYVEDNCSGNVPQQIRAVDGLHEIHHKVKEANVTGEMHL